VAFIEQTQNEAFPFYYNLHEGVGPDLNGNYRRDDIMLVQYLLKKVWAQGRFSFAPTLPPPPAPGDINPDGIYGNTTKRWIKEYQNMEKQRGNTVLADGRIDRILNQSAETSISHTIYTLFVLNKRFKEALPEVFENVNDDPDCPPDLKIILGVVITSGGGGDGE